MVVGTEIIVLGITAVIGLIGYLLKKKFESFVTRDELNSKLIESMAIINRTTADGLNALSTELKLMNSRMSLNSECLTEVKETVHTIASNTMSKEMCKILREKYPHVTE